MRQKLGEVIERDFNGLIKRKMEAVYAGQAVSDREKEKARDQRLAFIVSSTDLRCGRVQELIRGQIYLNNLDVSADYMDRLILNAQDSITTGFLETELEEVKKELRGLGGTSGDFRSTARVSIFGSTYRGVDH